MTTPIVVPPVAHRHRPVAVRATIAGLLFLGLSAVVGGIGLTSNSWFAESFPGDWLDRIPLIESWLIPGLVLGIGFGLGSLIAAYGMLRRPAWSWLGFVARASRFHWSWIMTVLIGAGQVSWILLEVIFLGGLVPLQLLYGGIGVALVLLPLLPSVRGYLRVESTWNG